MTVWGTNYWTERELKQAIQPAGFIRPLTEKEQYQLFLYQTVLDEGLAYKDYALLKRIVQCESSWRQFYRDGTVIVSSGNVGLGQINKLAHAATYSKMGLDVERWRDNLRFVVFLYKRDGIKPWEKWSGHCWKR